VSAKSSDHKHGRPADDGDRAEEHEDAVAIGFLCGYGLLPNGLAALAATLGMRGSGQDRGQ